VLRTHLSLAGGKVKATKREMSSLNSSLYQLAQSQRSSTSSGAASAGSQAGGSNSSHSNGPEDDEDRPADAAAGSPGVASRAVAQILRARLHDVRHNPSKAADELDFSPAIAAGADVIQQLPQLFPDAYWNNLAILSLHKGKPTRAVLMQFLQAASSSDEQSSRLKRDWHQSSLAQATQDSSAEIMYNTGIILMQLEKYSDALACFELAAKRATSTLGSPAFPLLGLRLAECHVQVYNQKRAQVMEAKSEPVYYKPGSIVRIEKLADASSTASGAVSEHISTARSNLFEYCRAPDTPVVHPTSQPTPYKDYLLKLYSKVLLAYVELESGNPVGAREVASQALELPRVAAPSSSASAGEAGSSAASYEQHISNYLLSANLYAYCLTDRQ
jgi:tetratricopeptide (TPR) repeat protein